MLRGRLADWRFRQIGSFHSLDSNSKRALEEGQLSPLIRSEQSGREAQCARPASAADTVNEVLGQLGQIVIDYVLRLT